MELKFNLYIMILTKLFSVDPKIGMAVVMVPSDSKFLTSEVKFLL